MSTTKLKTSLNNDEIRSILVDYLEGRFSLTEFQDKLRDHILLNFDSNLAERNIQNINIPESIKIIVHKKHLQSMLGKYLDEKISVKELSDWAAFIYMEPFYIPEGETEDERWQEGEGVVWNTIQKLATQDLTIKFNLTIAREYLETL